jgi:hypothetical protein
MKFTCTHTSTCRIGTTAAALKRSGSNEVQYNFVKQFGIFLITSV